MTKICVIESKKVPKKENSNFGIFILHKNIMLKSISQIKSTKTRMTYLTLAL